MEAKVGALEKWIQKIYINRDETFQ